MQIFVRDKGFYKNVLLIAVPIALQSMITIGINMMDTLMLGSFGEAQLSASALANQFYNIFQVLCMGMGGGTAVITAQSWGHGDIPAIKKALTLMLRICVVIALCFTAVSVLAPRAIMSIYTSEAMIIENGARYFRFLSYTYLFQGLAMTTTLILRSTKVVKVSLISSICAFFLNVFFNWVFIFGKLGAPRMEIAGAAVGTLIARVFEACFIMGYLLLKDKSIGYRIKDFFRPCSDMIQDFLHYSLPVICSDLLLVLGNNAVAIVMGRLGASFVSANAITVVTMQISTVFVQGISNASGIITGNTLGEGHTEKAYRQGVTFLALSVLVGLAAGGLITLLSRSIVDFYNVTAETKAIAHELMLALSFIVVFQMISSVMTKGVLRGGGDTRFLLVADVLFLWVASVPLGYLAGFVWNLSPFWIYTCLKIDMILKSAWCVQRLVSRKWIHVVV